MYQSVTIDACQESCTTRERAYSTNTCLTLLMLVRKEPRISSQTTEQTFKQSVLGPTFCTRQPGYMNNLQAAVKSTAIYTHLTCESMYCLHCLFKSRIYYNGYPAYKYPVRTIRRIIEKLSEGDGSSSEPETRAPGKRIAEQQAKGKSTKPLYLHLIITVYNYESLNSHC